MGFKLAQDVMFSSIYPKNPRRKLMLIALCNWADPEKGSGYCFNDPLAKAAGFGVEAVRRNKKVLKEDGLVNFTYKGGYSRQTDFQIDLKALQARLDFVADTNKDRSSDPTSKGGVGDPTSKGGVEESPTPLLSNPTPLLSPSDPTSRGGVIRDSNLNRHAREGARDIITNMIDQKDIEKTLRSFFGDDWFKSWLKEAQIIPRGENVEIYVPKAFGKARVEQALQSSPNFQNYRVHVAKKDVRARA